MIPHFPLRAAKPIQRITEPARHKAAAQALRASAPKGASVPGKARTPQRRVARGN